MPNLMETDRHLGIVIPYIHSFIHSFVIMIDRHHIG
jgi:hypothetical protein